MAGVALVTSCTFIVGPVFVGLHKLSREFLPLPTKSSSSFEVWTALLEKFLGDSWVTKYADAPTVLLNLANDKCVECSKFKPLVNVLAKKQALKLCHDNVMHQPHTLQLLDQLGHGDATVTIRTTLFHYQGCTSTL